MSKNQNSDEGLKYAKWLKEHQGEFQGAICCMPIFADENGAITALRDAGVPILMQAYPDEIGKMDFAHRRDAFCGKFSVTDVFYQYKVPFTVMKPHVVHPLTPAFRQNLDDFARICNVVKGMRRFNLGCIGARTTAFKTVRFDEVTMQRYGVNVESFDLSELFEFVRATKDNDPKVVAMVKDLEDYADFSSVAADKKLTLAKIAVVIQGYIDTYHLDAFALRCWNEMETYLRVCPCVLLSYFNDKGIAASCEIDMCSAITMRALTLASENPSACLDWNNNYGDDENKVILFHCGSTANSLLKCKGCVKSHKMFDKRGFGSFSLVNELDIFANNIESITIVGLCSDICVVTNALMLRAQFTNTPIYYALGNHEYRMDLYRDDFKDALKKGQLSLNNYAPVGTWEGLPEMWHGHEPCIAMILEWLTDMQMRIAADIKRRTDEGDQMAMMADPMKDVLDAAVNESNRFAYARRAIAELNQLASTPDKERGSILSTALAGISIFKNAAVKERTKFSDFAYRDLRGMVDPTINEMRPVSVYLSINQVDAKALNSITGIFVELLSSFLIFS